MEKTLYERKDELRKKWERIFETSVHDVLKIETINRFWSSNTSLEEAEKILDGAAFLLFLSSLGISKSGSGIMVVSVGSDDDEEEPTGPATEQYQVYNKVTKDFYDHIFESKKAADEFVVREACNSVFKFDDFKVVRVYD